MKKKAEIVPKLIIIFATLSLLGIVLLFFIPRSRKETRQKKPESTQRLFANVIQAAMPKIKKLWEEGDRLIKKDGLQCNDEVILDKNVGRSFYQCQPHFWQCFWSGGVNGKTAIEVEVFGEIYHVRAQQRFQPISEYSSQKRFYEILKGPYNGLNFHYGVLIELSIDEVPDLKWPLIMTDTCRDTYLPQRIYGYSKVDQKKSDSGFEWDNFDRHIFIDKFYVSNQMVNEWRVLTNQKDKMISERAKWAYPALLTQKEQKEYCGFWGKRVLEAKLFDAAAMTPSDIKNPLPDRVARPQTPWQRDLSKTFLGMARINPDYQLTPLDCDLAQVQGCREKYYTTDSVTWMGMNFALGFYPESLVNNIEPEKNIKMSSRFRAAEAEVHELGVLGLWDGENQIEFPVAFRCYEEVTP